MYCVFVKACIEIYFPFYEGQFKIRKGWVHLTSLSEKRWRGKYQPCTIVDVA